MKRGTFLLLLGMLSAANFAATRPGTERWSGSNGIWEVDIKLFPGGHFSSSETFSGDMAKPVPNVLMDGKWKRGKYGFVTLVPSEVRYEVFGKISEPPIVSERRRILLTFDRDHLIWSFAGFGGATQFIYRQGVTRTR